VYKVPSMGNLKCLVRVLRRSHALSPREIHDPRSAIRDLGGFVASAVALPRLRHPFSIDSIPREKPDGYLR
jgi:hypothetical protein